MTDQVAVFDKLLIVLWSVESIKEYNIAVHIHYKLPENVSITD